jgi:hypothetical protein
MITIGDEFFGYWRIHLYLLLCSTVNVLVVDEVLQDEIRHDCSWIEFDDSVRFYGWRVVCPWGFFGRDPAGGGDSALCKAYFLGSGGEADMEEMPEQPRKETRVQKSG